ncbi:Harbinger transposase-derived nuclease [Corchorus capsularis]|uniref:Harbinger transposase-derived nuclease n=1 Tax=Corchorus capsularis TaxID=210143 RepID=A0A1R3GLP1_COCAP|nr:Harbinger transposase-derived nuclease [Corchorus capsularis]
MAYNIAIDQENVGTNNNLNHNDPMDVSNHNDEEGLLPDSIATNQDYLAWISVVTNFILAIPSLVFDQLSSKEHHQYALASMNCIGAIDGTHISASVSVDKQIPYCGKKIETTQNVMCACSFDMRFTYVMAGWEGTANDTRVFLECISNSQNNFPMPPIGKYYLVDSGYTNMPGFLSPYRGERYHLRDYRGRGRQPTGPEEIFNHRHSFLRNCIERCFGVLKARFPILKVMPPYSSRMQRYIVIACCTVHNFIRTHRIRDLMFEEFGRDDLIIDEDETLRAKTSQNHVEVNVTASQLQQMARVRDEIATQLWKNSQNT